MRRIITLLTVLAIASVLMVTMSVAAFAQCDVSVGVGAIDAEVCLSDEGVGVGADAGAIDVQTGTDRETCADAGAINVPPDQQFCPPQ
jgi:hypothetical protein